MPPAQFYHWCEVKMKMWTMNLGKPVNIPKLNENMAIELGAELLGEGVIFVTAAAILVFEYVRNSRKETAKEESRNQELSRVQEELKDLYFAKAKQEAQLREVIRFLHKTHPTASPISESYSLSDIPEHHRHAAVEEEGWSVLGSMKGLIWSAVDIILPPVNQPNESPAELPHPPDTKKVRILVVPEEPASQKSPSALNPSTSSSSVDPKSNSSNPSNSNSKPGGSGAAGTGPSGGTDKSKLPA